MNFVFLDDQVSGKQRLYKNPLRMITAQTVQEVDAALIAMQAARDEGHYLAGYFAYELGLAIEPKLQPLLAEGLVVPLLSFGVFEAYEQALEIKDEQIAIEQIMPMWSSEYYTKKFETVLSYIRAGDVYQINLTFPMQARAKGSALGLYQYLKSKQPVRYGGVVKLGGETIISLSPEQFFEVQDDKISLRPMKGTIRRGQTTQEDKVLKSELVGDSKSRAENLMIVDLLRNDVSRLAKSGSVKVTDLFTLETYPSLHTMTSGVEAILEAGWTIKDVVKALFPCGSVTGAPKIRAMEIIHALEARPRGVYCGAVGIFDPSTDNSSGDASFNVAIRTLSLSSNGDLIYPVGGGVVADSSAQSEYAEALLKAKVLEDEFGLIETLGWHKQTEFLHMDLHLARLFKSAAHFGFSYNEAEILNHLENAVKTQERAARIRLELAQDGSVQINVQPLELTAQNTIMDIAISGRLRQSNDPFWRHKTTRRVVMDGDAARVQNQTGAIETIFANESGEICEGSYTNVFMRRNGVLITPPLSSGLLPGILRTVMLANKDAIEGIITREDFQSAGEIYIGNSVRGLIPARLVRTDPI